MNAGELVLAVVRASLEGGALLLLLWFACRAWPGMPATARTSLWWLGALRMIAGLFPIPRIPLSFAPTSRTIGALAETPVGAQVSSAVDLARTAPVMSSTGGGVSPVLWVMGGLIVVWLAGVVAAAWVMTRRLLVLRRQWRRAIPVTDPRVVALRSDWAIVLGKDRVPEVRTAPDVTVPVTVGGFRMGVLLPPGSEQLSDDTLRLVFAHEMSHVRRRDPLLAWIPALAQLVFWFHPLARIAAREYLAAREESCDVEALRVTGSSPGDYGALLLEFGVGRIAALPGSASCGAVNARDLKRRLDMLTRSWRIPRTHRFAGALTVFLFLLLAFAPVRLVGAYEEGNAAGSKSSRTPFSYLLLKKGEIGSRGAIAMSDLDNIRQFQDPDRRNTDNFTYFRINDDAWFSNDPTLFAEVTAAMEPIDAFEAPRMELEKKRMALERERMKLEERSMTLDERKEQLQQRMTSLEDARANGRSQRELAAMKADIDEETDDLYAERQELFRLREEQHEKYRALGLFDKKAYAEGDRIHQQVMLDIKRIAKRAITDGRAKPLDD